MSASLHEHPHRLFAARSLVGLPVVTRHGDRLAEVKDVVFDRGAGAITGFTLRKPGFLGGPLAEALPMANVRAVGRSAVMTTGPEALVPGADAGQGDPVLADRVITDDGAELGTVVDVVVLVEGSDASIAGFEVEPASEVGNGGHHVFVPLPKATAMSDEAVVVPASAREYVSQDFTGFGGAVDAFRAALEASS